MDVRSWWGVAALAAAGAAGGFAWRALRLGRSLRERCAALESGHAALRGELDRLNSQNVDLGHRMQRVEQDCAHVAERVDAVESIGAAVAGSVTLEQAIDWARRGIAPERLARQFGLTQGEAELLARLHGAGEGSEASSPLGEPLQRS